MGKLDSTKEPETWVRRAVFMRCDENGTRKASLSIILCRGGWRRRGRSDEE